MVSRTSKWLPEAYTSALLSVARKGVIFRRDDNDEVVAKQVHELFLQAAGEHRWRP